MCGICHQVATARHCPQMQWKLYRTLDKSFIEVVRFNQPQCIEKDVMFRNGNSVATKGLKSETFPQHNEDDPLLNAFLVVNVLVIGC